MNQVPNNMYHCRMHLLDPMDAVGRHDETVIRDLWKAAAVLARESYRQDLFFARCLQRVNQIGRLTAGAEYHCHVTRLAQQPKLIDEDPSKVNVITDRGHGCDIGHQRNYGKRGPLFDDRVIELDAHVERIAQAAAVSHDKEPASSLKTLRQRTRHRFERFGVFREKLLFHLDALAAFANYLGAKAFVRLVNGGDDLGS